jgi:hypothetical protein
LGHWPVIVDVSPAIGYALRVRAKEFHLLRHCPQNFGVYMCVGKIYAACRFTLVGWCFVHVPVLLYELDPTPDNASAAPACEPNRQA